MKKLIKGLGISIIAKTTLMKVTEFIVNTVGICPTTIKSNVFMQFFSLVQKRKSKCQNDIFRC